MTPLLAGIATGATIVAAYAAITVAVGRHMARQARREATAVARGHGVISGRTLRQMGGNCPNAWPSNDPDLDAFNKGAVRGWLEADVEIRKAERWVVAEAERIAGEAV